MFETTRILYFKVDIRLFIFTFSWGLPKLLKFECLFILRPVSSFPHGPDYGLLNISWC